MNDKIEVPPPGHFIREELEARGWSQRDLAYILGVSDPEINVIISGKRGVSAEMAKALGKAFDVPAEFFANLQKAYDLSHAREPDANVERKAKLQSVYPIREMIKRSWLTDANAAILEAEIARFFEVPSADQIPHLAHAARKANYQNISPIQLAWLYRVRQIAREMVVPNYSEKALKDALGRLRMLMVDPLDTREVPHILSECGVRFVIVEGLPNAKIDGACFWLGKSPVIGMSLRFDRIDNFWFVLRHEIEHVLQRHGRDREIVDIELEGDRAGYESNTLSQEERVANRAASDFCVPIGEMDSFIARKTPFFSERDLLGFARRLQLHPGIVAGQLRKRINRWDIFTKLLVKVRDAAISAATVDGWGHVAPVSG
ncbi:MAG TPA: HigA family addiction module antitoxin [Stellaceae bacterium]|nr:HigA family addiction module antitoxin [Stellaceae bacterium]